MDAVSLRGSNPCWTQPIHRTTTARSASSRACGVLARSEGAARDPHKVDTVLSQYADGDGADEDDSRDHALPERVDIPQRKTVLDDAKEEHSYCCAEKVPISADEK